MNPLVSIITPAFNAENFIDDCINSIQNQTLKNWELLITDDLSTDKTLSIVKKFAATDNRIRVFQNFENIGAGRSRNICIRNARGRYIAFCDADDMWKPDKLEKQLSFMRLKKISFTYSNYTKVDETGNILAVINCPTRINLSKILSNNYIGCLTAIYDTQILGKVFMNPIRKRQDWVLWIEIITKIKQTEGMNESLAFYRITNNSISRNKLGLLKYTWLVYYQVLDFNLIKSIYHLFKFLFEYAKKQTKNIYS